MSKQVKNMLDHPPTSEMVIIAIQELQDPTGSSYQAIKKHICSTNDIDVDKYAPIIKRFLKKAVASGILLQTKGQGASGSFKLAAKEKTSQSSARNSRALNRNTGEGSTITTEKKKANKVGGKIPKAKTTTALKSASKVTKIKKAANPEKAVSPRKNVTSRKVISSKKASLDAE